MALKKPSQQAPANRYNVTAEAADALANRLADKPYGAEIPKAVPESKLTSVVVAEIVSRTTISLPDSMLIEIEDLARDNKRNGTGPKTVSAIAREAFNIYLISMKS